MSRVGRWSNLFSVTGKGREGSRGGEEWKKVREFRPGRYAVDPSGELKHRWRGGGEGVARREKEGEK